MSLEHVTVVFLIAVFAAAEIYRGMRSSRGVILRVEDSGFGPVPLPVTRVRVRCEDGREVSADLNCCTACLGRLKVGDEVRLSDSKDGYVIDLPWLQRKRCV